MENGTSRVTPKKGMKIRNLADRLGKSPYWNILVFYVGWRLAILLLFYLALSIINTQVTGSYPGSVWAAHLNGDGAAYIRIAEYGYREACSMGGNIITLRLFPLFPLVIRGLSYITSGNYLAASILASTFCTLIMLFFLWKLLRLDDDETVSHRAVTYLLIFPAAVFLAVAYSESLFMLTLVASIYEARRNRWLAAGLWGMLCALTRPVGVLAAIVLAWEYLRQTGFSLRRVRTGVFCLFLVPLGSFLYMAYLWSTFGDPFIFIKAQDIAHGRQFSIFIYRPVTRAVEVIRSGPLLDPQRAITIFNLVILIMFICLTVYAIFRLPSTYTVLMVVFLFAMLMMDSTSYPLASISRYVLPLFPAFILLAYLGARREFNRLYTIISSLLLGLFVVVYALERYFLA